MARIAGIDIPDDKKIWVSLTHVYGIGKVTSRKIVSDLGFDEKINLGQLSEAQIDNDYCNSTVRKYPIMFYSKV